jgi:hypothetical protein
VEFKHRRTYDRQLRRERPAVRKATDPVPEKEIPRAAENSRIAKPIRVLDEQSRTTEQVSAHKAAAL